MGMGRESPPIFTILAATTYQKGIAQFRVQNALLCLDANNDWIKLESSQREIL